MIDLMGFTIAGPNRFYASGHPGEGTDLPNPVGLIASTDHGRTLETSCPRGVSPTSTRSLPPTGVLGNDGTLLASQDGRQWPDLQLPLPPTALAASPDGRTVLAATDAGLLRSTDAAQTWAAPPGAPPLKVLSWAEGHDGRATFDGAVHVSIDTGLTWQGRGRTAPPQAITAADAAAGLRVLVVTAEEVFDSVDGGITFTSLKNPGR